MATKETMIEILNDSEFISFMINGDSPIPSYYDILKTENQLLEDGYPDTPQGIKALTEATIIREILENEIEESYEYYVEEIRDENEAWNIQIA